MMTIPREHHMVRFYVCLDDSEPDSHQNNPLFDHIVSRISNILAPYIFHFDVCDWWSSYQVRQQLATAFSDTSQRVFLVGDASIRTPPKAGQGMNVNIQDAWNLGWKLAAVINGQAESTLLHTYEVERRPVAKLLLEFDKKMLSCFQSFSLCHESNKHGKGNVEATIEEEHSSASGIEVTYAGLRQRSVLNNLPSPEVAPGIKLGHRIGDFNVVRHADGLVQSFHCVLPADGRWRAVVFSGTITQGEQRRRLDNIGRVLGSGNTVLPTSLTLGQRAECEMILIHASSRDDACILDMPSIFRPWSKSWGWNYDRVFVDDPGYETEQYTPVYNSLGISKSNGCLIVIRPRPACVFRWDVGCLVLMGM